jgi:hypothetical protein
MQVAPCWAFFLFILAEPTSMQTTHSDHPNAIVDCSTSSICVFWIGFESTPVPRPRLEISCAARFVLQSGREGRDSRELRVTRPRRQHPQRARGGDRPSDQLRQFSCAQACALSGQGLCFARAAGVCRNCIIASAAATAMRCWTSGVSNEASSFRLTITPHSRSAAGIAAVLSTMRLSNS